MVHVVFLTRGLVVDGSRVLTSTCFKNTFQVVLNDTWISDPWFTCLNFHVPQKHTPRVFLNTWISYPWLSLWIASHLNGRTRRGRWRGRIPFYPGPKRDVGRG